MKLNSVKINSITSYKKKPNLFELFLFKFLSKNNCLSIDSQLPQSVIKIEPQIQCLS